MSDENVTSAPPASEGAPEGQEHQLGQPRDENGRFASQQPQPEPQSPEPAQAQPEGGQQPEQRQPPPAGFVPQQALGEAREKARTVEAENAELRQHLQSMQGQIAQLTGYVAGAVKPPEQPAQPDWFADPDAAFRARLETAVQPLAQQTSQWREQVSRMMAEDKHGSEAVQAADRALGQHLQANPQAKAWLGPRIMNSSHPYGEMVRWHQEQAALQQTGTDPGKWFEAEFEKRFGVKPDQAQFAQPPAGQQPAPTPPGPMPTSFTQARNAGPRSQPQWQGPRPLSEILPR